MKVKIVHQNPWFKVTKEEFTRHDGMECTFYIVNRKKSVFVVPTDKDGSIYLVRLYRYATKTWGWELPAGGNDGEEPLVAAKRELQEETGLIANHWEEVGIIHLTPGVSTNITNIFIARDLTQTDENEQEEEGIVDCKKFTIDEIKAMIMAGDIHDAPTIAALARVLWAEKGFMGE